MLFVIISVIYRPVEQLLSRTIADRRARGRTRRTRCASPLAIQAGFALVFLVVALALRGPDRGRPLRRLARAVLDPRRRGARLRGELLRPRLARRPPAGSALYGGLVLFESISRFCSRSPSRSGSPPARPRWRWASRPRRSPRWSWSRARRAPRGQRPRRRPARGGRARARPRRPDAARRRRLRAARSPAIQLAEQTLLNAAVLIVDGTSGAAVAGVVFNALLIARAPLQLFQAVQTSLLPHLAGLEATRGQRRVRPRDPRRRARDRRLRRRGRARPARHRARGSWSIVFGDGLRLRPRRPGASSRSAWASTSPPGRSTRRRWPAAAPPPRPRLAGRAPRPSSSGCSSPLVDDVLLRAEVGYAGCGARCCAAAAVGPGAARRGGTADRCPRPPEDAGARAALAGAGRAGGARRRPPGLRPRARAPRTARRRRARRRGGGRRPAGRRRAGRGAGPPAAGAVGSTSTTSPWPRRASATSGSTAPSPGPPSTPPRRSSPRPTAGSAPTATTRTIAPRSWAPWASPDPARRGCRRRGRARAAAVEAAVVAAGGCAAAVRSAEAWAGHPQGRLLAARRPRSGSSPARTAVLRAARPAAAGALPCAGLRVLDLTRVIAGPVATPTLAALGADVLRVDPPGRPELALRALDGGLGKRRRRSTWPPRTAAPAGSASWPAPTSWSTAPRPGRSPAFGLDPRRPGRAPPARRARVPLGVGAQARAPRARGAASTRSSRPPTRRRRGRAAARRGRPAGRAARAGPRPRPPATSWPRGPARPRRAGSPPGAQGGRGWPWPRTAQALLAAGRARRAGRGASPTRTRT